METPHQGMGAPKSFNRCEQLGMGCLRPRVGSTGKRPFSVSAGQGLAYPQKGDVGSRSGGQTVSGGPLSKKSRVSRRQHYGSSLLARRRWRRRLDDTHGQASLEGLGPSGSFGVFSAVDTRKHFEPGSRLVVSVGGHRRLGARSTDHPTLVGLERRMGGRSVRKDEHNKKAKRFNSLVLVEGTEAVETFTQDWKNGKSLL